jgi:hypothetical protein
MSDCFDHELEAWESLERCMEEGRVQFDNECNITIIMPDGLCSSPKDDNPDDYKYDDKPDDYTASVEIETTVDSYWIRFGDPKQSSSFYGDHAGKYLIFSDDQETLIAIAKDEIENFGFHDAKVSVRPNNKDYVLCLYWCDDQRGYELLTRYGNKEHVRYRWWKSNHDTRAGKYSQEHRRNRR